MRQNSRSKEWAILFVVFGVLPALFIGLLLMPSLKRDAEYLERQRKADQRIQELPAVQPLNAEERKVLEDPSAPWRRRIPLISSDAARLGHYHRVVTGLQSACKQSGIALLGVRSTWDPIRGSFTLPAVLASGPLLPVEGGSQGRLEAWVLEAHVDGPTPQLFRALEGIPRVDPLLEPIGFRWEGDEKGLRQYLLLRNPVLAP
jgi:hypothetical protein